MSKRVFDEAAAARPILALKKRAEKLLKFAFNDYVKIGKHLKDVNERIGHGRWGTWLHKYFGWSQSTALNFMRLYELSLDPKFASLTNLPRDFLYLLARQDEETRKEIAELNEAGESTKTMRAAIKGRQIVRVMVQNGPENGPSRTDADSPVIVSYKVDPAEKPSGITVAVQQDPGAPPAAPSLMTSTHEYNRSTALIILRHVEDFGRALQVRNGFCSADQLQMMIEVVENREQFDVMLRLVEEFVTQYRARCAEQRRGDMKLVG